MYYYELYEKQKTQWPKQNKPKNKLIKIKQYEPRNKVSEGRTELKERKNWK